MWINLPVWVENYDISRLRAFIDLCKDPKICEQSLRCNMTVFTLFANETKILLTSERAPICGGWHAEIWAHRFVEANKQEEKS